MLADDDQNAVTPPSQLKSGTRFQHVKTASRTARSTKHGTKYGTRHRSEVIQLSHRFSVAVPFPRAHYLRRFRRRPTTNRNRAQPSSHLVLRQQRIKKEPTLLQQPALQIIWI